MRRAIPGVLAQSLWFTLSSAFGFHFLAFTIRQSGCPLGCCENNTAGMGDFHLSQLESTLSTIMLSYELFKVCPAHLSSDVSQVPVRS